MIDFDSLVGRAALLVRDPPAFAIEDHDGVLGQVDGAAIRSTDDDLLAATRTASIALGWRVERMRAGRAGRADDRYRKARRTKLTALVSSLTDR